MSEASLVDYPAVTFASISQPVHFTELPTVIPALISRVAAAVGPSIVGPPRVYYTEWETESGVASVGFPVQTGTIGTDGVECREFSAGRAVKVTHLGPYSEMMKGWQHAMGAAEEQGRTKTNFAWEDYVGDPTESKPEELATDIYVGVQA